MIAEMIGQVAGLINNVVDKFVEDKGAAATREAAILKAQLQQQLQTYILEHEERLKQIEVDLEEAKHPSLFVAGWRPFIGWSCGAGLLVALLGTVIAPFLGYDISDAIPTDLILAVLGAMMGVSGMRSFDKSKGVDTQRIRRRRK